MTSPKDENITTQGAGTQDLTEQAEVQAPETAEAPAPAHPQQEQAAIVQKNVTAVSTAVQDKAQGAIALTPGENVKKEMSPDKRKALDEYLEQVKDYQKYFSIKLRPDQSVEMLVDTAFKPGTGKSGEPTGQKELIPFEINPQKILARTSDVSLEDQHEIFHSYARSFSYEILPPSSVKISDLSAEELASVGCMLEFGKMSGNSRFFTEIGRKEMAHFLEMDEQLLDEDPVQFLKEISAKIPDQKLAREFTMFTLAGLINNYKDWGLWEYLDTTQLTEIFKFVEETCGHDFMKEFIDYALRASLRSGGVYPQLMDCAFVPLLQMASDIHKKYTIPCLVEEQYRACIKEAWYTRHHGQKPVDEGILTAFENAKKFLADIGINFEEVQQTIRGSVPGWKPCHIYFGYFDHDQNYGF